MIILGAVLTAVGIGLLVFDIVGTVTESGARNGALVEVPLPGSETVELAPGSYVAVALGHGLVATQIDAGLDRRINVRGPFAPPEVTVETTNGEALPSADPNIEILEDRPGTDAASVVQFEIVESGTYQVSARHPADSEGPVTSVVLRKASGLDSFGARDTIVASGLMALGGLLLMGGLLWGVLRWVGRLRSGIAGGLPPN